MQSKYGREKYGVPYGDQNWSRVEDGLNRYGDARVRHVLDEAIEGLYDSGPKGSHRLHAAAAAWNALAYLELLLRDGVEPENLPAPTVSMDTELLKAAAECWEEGDVLHIGTFAPGEEVTTEKLDEMLKNGPRFQSIKSRSERAHRDRDTEPGNTLEQQLKRDVEDD